MIVKSKYKHFLKWRRMKNLNLKLIVLLSIFIANSNAEEFHAPFAATPSVDRNKITLNDKTPWAPIKKVDDDHFGVNLANTPDYIIQTGINSFSLTWDKKTAVVSYVDLEKDPESLANVEGALGWQKGFIAEKIAEAKKNHDSLLCKNASLWTMMTLPTVAIVSPRETRVRNVSACAMLGSIHLALLQSSPIYQLDQRINQINLR